ncbi:DUF3122 domain-containing protein [Rivularia sp. UHCC 0363]|uniref:DUF3122 domain-containing protein n=1 Tax=Rivularia sp. UHCC 0363 TaxID=3110244 RepID=UPI002B21BED3|nr:DUF3122 domain-containing protein [Rivularia sp. UHCC 0363]MEA5599186.1 DUF3122 domain-containing protein [Rivularia sp. UHCC 0363]
MTHHIRQIVAFLTMTALVWVCWLGIIFQASPASAAIRSLEEAPGQLVYQSRQPLKDQHGNTWQAIAFKRIRPDGSTVLALRLVGFPGIAEINRERPLTLTNSLGKTLTAEDASQKIFTDAAAPEANVGQYDLAPIVSALTAVIPWQLSLPTLDGEPVELSVPPTLVQEWQTLFNQS